MLIYKPYTYLLGWTKQNKWYYGCQYCNSKSRGIANPSNLWFTYFTSSDYVKTFREIYGEPDVIEVRKTFDTADEARLWEEKVIDKIDAVNSDYWLNRQNKGKKFFVSLEIYKEMGERRKNIPLSEEWKQKLRRPSPFKGKKREPFSKEWKQSIGIESGKARMGVKRGNYVALICPHCGVEGRGGAMKQWHFDKCKKKENDL